MDNNVTIVALILNDGTTLELTEISTRVCRYCYFFDGNKLKDCPKIKDRLICSFSNENSIFTKK